MDCQMMVFESVSITGAATMAKKGTENLEDFNKLLTENQEAMDIDMKEPEMVSGPKVAETEMTEVGKFQGKKADLKMPDHKNLDLKGLKSEAADVEMDDIEDDRGLFSEVKVSELKTQDIKMNSKKISEVKTQVEMMDYDIEMSDMKIPDMKEIDTGIYEVDKQEMCNQEMELVAEKSPEAEKADINGDSGKKEITKDDSHKIQKPDSLSKDDAEEKHNIIGNLLSMDIRENLDYLKTENVGITGQKLQNVIDLHVDRNSIRRNSTEDIIASRIMAETETATEIQIEMPVGDEFSEMSKTEVGITAGKLTEENLKVQGYEKSERPIENIDSKMVSKGNMNLEKFDKVTVTESLENVLQEEIIPEKKEQMNDVHGKRFDIEAKIVNPEAEIKTEKYFPGNKSDIISKTDKVSMKADEVQAEMKDSEIETPTVKVNTQDVLTRMRTMAAESSERASERRPEMTKNNGIEKGIEEGSDKLKPEIIEKTNTVSGKVLDFSSNMTRQMESAVEIDVITGEKQELAKTSLINQMSQSIETGTDGDSNFIRINLKPHLFGQMSIDLVKSAEGITARISADKDVVKNLLSNSGKEIAALFESKNMKVENIVIETRESAEHQAYSERNRQGFNGSFSGQSSEGSRHGYNQERDGNESKNPWTSAHGNHEEVSQITRMDQTEKSYYGQGINIVV